MCDMFFCFSDAPVDDDPRQGNYNYWKITMKEAPYESPVCCLYGCCCGPCAQYQLRQRALGGTLRDYKCCQGYISMFCCQAGNLGEQNAPQLCLCLEVCCCHSCALSATRFLIMDQKNLVSDPCDNRIIRFNNWLQCLSCIIDIVAIFVEELREAADIIRCIANLVYWTTAGCMTAQMFYELDDSKVPRQAGRPPQQEMTRQMVDPSKPGIHEASEQAGTYYPAAEPAYSQSPYGQSPYGQTAIATPVSATPVEAVPTQEVKPPYPMDSHVSRF